MFRLSPRLDTNWQFFVLLALLSLITLTCTLDFNTSPNAWQELEADVLIATTRIGGLVWVRRTPAGVDTIDLNLDVRAHILAVEVVSESVYILALIPP